jgi:hypothetical protein
MSNLWAAEWHSKNIFDGEVRHFIYENRLPKLFCTRAECRKFIKDKYGYIKTRKDLRIEPHGWRLPVPVKVKVSKI